MFQLSKNLSVASILYLLMGDFICEKPYTNTKNCSQLNQAILEYTNTCIPPNIYQQLQFVMSHTHLHLILQLTLHFQTALLPALHSNSHTATLLMPTSTGKLQLTFKVKCHVHYRFYVFLNNVTCIKLWCCFY